MVYSCDVVIRLFCQRCCFVVCFFFKQKTAYELRISDWSSDVCSSDLNVVEFYRTRFSIRPVVEPYAVLQQEIYLRTIRGEGELTAFGGCHLFAGGRLLAQEYAFQFRACLVDEIRRQPYSFEIGRAHV